MNKQLSPEHQELYGGVGEVLHYLWDPIGVSGVPQARDEYDSYVPQVFSLLVSQASTQGLIAFLDHTATQTMGLNDTEQGREHTKAVVRILEDWREFLRDRYARNA